MPFAKGKKRAPGAGRKKGIPNKATVAARKLLESDDKAITDKIIAQAKAGDNTAIGFYLRYLRAPLPRSTVVAPIELEPPKNAQEARDAIARITSMIAEGEVDATHGGAVIAGLQAYLNAKAAEFEALYEQEKAREGRT
jgi:hypothetical protein